ncbi:hypothetical protein WA026_000452 [Henosepilachna vigintioctopunctata]|uniref:HMG box domain-containing protein n=1 Tax=Henosepilachna vigintioctopunctata TaxID=420089 RepID=A0AAW1V5T2_9CUCU
MRIKMISSSIFSKPLYFGKHFITSNRNTGFLTPKIVTPLLSNPFSLLKSQNTIKLPEKPKKPLTPFFKYLQEYRPITQKEHPQLKLTEIIKKCSQDWKNVHSTVKEKYETEYREELNAYVKKHLEYSVKLTEEQRMYIKELTEEKRRMVEKRKNKKLLKELNKPKKPPSAFLIFLMDQAKIQNRKVNELMKEAGMLWENLDESVKLRYSNQAKLALASYSKQVEDWESKMLLEGNTKVIRVKTLEEKRPASSKNTKNSKSEKTSLNKKNNKDKTLDE